MLTGRDKKRRGTVLSRVDIDHVLVEGINVVKNIRAPTRCREQLAALPTKLCPFTFQMWRSSTPQLGKPTVLASRKWKAAKFAFSAQAVNRSVRRRKELI